MRRNSLSHRIESLEAKFGTTQEARAIIVTINPNNLPEDDFHIDLRCGGLWRLRDVVDCSAKKKFASSEQNMRGTNYGLDRRLGTDRGSRDPIITARAPLTRLSDTPLTIECPLHTGVPLD
jgi:hypothetical protein